MSYSILPFLLIIIPLFIIVVVVVRKFPQLSLLDVDTLPDVKDEKKQNEVLKKRAEREAARNKRQWVRRLKPVEQKLKDVQLSFRKYVGDMQRKVEEEKNKPQSTIQPERKTMKQGRLPTHNDQPEEKDDWRVEEKKFLSAIKRDPKDIVAYKQLAALYEAEGQQEEAIETYKFILRLDPDDAEVKRKIEE